MSQVDPAFADRVRKVVATLVAVAATVLLFRVLARLANGTLDGGDPSLWALVILVFVSGVWVAKARRVRRPPSSPNEERTPLRADDRR